VPDAGQPPILEFDPNPNAVFEPHHVVVRGEEPVPERAVLCFFSQVMDRLRDGGAPVLFELEAAHGVHPVFGFEADGERIAVFHPGVGAALAGGFFEESIAHGCERFMAVGTAGGLAPRAIGHVIVPTFAMRDEGTSYHYQPPGRAIEPTPDALEALIATLERHDIPFETGGTWTTDGFYRETRAKLDRRVAEGCLAVEMEASALFAIARFRRVPIAQLLTTSDDLSGEEWSGMRLHDRDDFRWSLFLLAVEAVRAL
jgi:uridine phosphorylase